MHLNYIVAVLFLSSDDTVCCYSHHYQIHVAHDCVRKETLFRDLRFAALFQQSKTSCKSMFLETRLFQMFDLAIFNDIVTWQYS